MSIESMCSGSTIVRQTQTHTVGAAGGDVSTWADGAAHDCAAQTMDASVATRYDIRGERRGWTLFFSSDPSLTPDQRVRLTVQAGRTLASPKLLRVLASYAEDDPAGRLGGLWVVDCEEITTRFDT